MGHVVVAVDLFERSVLVPEVASLAVRAELLSVELPAVLRFVLVVEARLSLGDPVDLGKFLGTVGILALEAVAAEATLSPVLAHLAFVFLGLGNGDHLAILHKRQNRNALFVVIGRCSSGGVEWLYIVGQRYSWHEGGGLRSLEGEWVGPRAHVGAPLGARLALVSTDLSEWGSGRRWDEACAFGAQREV